VVVVGVAVDDSFLEKNDLCSSKIVEARFFSSSTMFLRASVSLLSWGLRLLDISFPNFESLSCVDAIIIVGVESIAIILLYRDILSLSPSRSSFSLNSLRSPGDLISTPVFRDSISGPVS